MTRTGPMTRPVDVGPPSITRSGQRRCFPARRRWRRIGAAAGPRPAVACSVRRRSVSSSIAATLAIFCRPPARSRPASVKHGPARRASLLGVAGALHFLGPLGGRHDTRRRLPRLASPSISVEARAVWRRYHFGRMSEIAIDLGARSVRLALFASRCSSLSLRGADVDSMRRSRRAPPVALAIELALAECHACFISPPVPCHSISCCRNAPRPRRFSPPGAPLEVELLLAGLALILALDVAWRAASRSHALPGIGVNFREVLAQLFPRRVRRLQLRCGSRFEVGELRPSAPSAAASPNSISSFVRLASSCAACFSTSRRRCASAGQRLALTLRVSLALLAVSQAIGGRGPRPASGVSCPPSPLGDCCAISWRNCSSSASLFASLLGDCAGRPQRGRRCRPGALALGRLALASRPTLVTGGAPASWQATDICSERVRVASRSLRAPADPPSADCAVSLRAGRAPPPPPPRVWWGGAGVVWGGGGEVVGGGLWWGGLWF